MKSKRTVPFGKKACPNCNEYCPAACRACPHCKETFEKSTSNSNPAKGVARFTVRIPAEYRGYEVTSIIAIPAGPSPFPFPKELNQQEISSWGYKIRMFHLKNKRFIKNEGLAYYARKTLDWTTPEFAEFMTYLNMVEDMALEEKAEVVNED